VNPAGGRSVPLRRRSSRSRLSTGRISTSPATTVYQRHRDVTAGGVIDLAVARRGERVEIVLADSGPGIVPETRSKVFDRFVRVDPSRTLPGTGLGLSLVKAFVELHGGSISLSDSRLGGAAFTILLPVQ
jgi:signal transduction histidine kinase